MIVNVELELELSCCLKNPMSSMVFSAVLADMCNIV